jgi:hypothetical protein
MNSAETVCASLCRVTAALGAGAPGRLGHEQQRVKMRKHADFMALHLVGAATLVFGAGGRQPFARFQLRVLIAAVPRPLAQFPLVMLEVIVHAIQLAPQMVFLARPNGLEVFRHFAGQRVAQQFAATRGVQRGPVDRSPGTGAPGKSEGRRQRVLPNPIRKRYRQPVQRPVLVNGLDLAADQRQQRKMPGGSQRRFEPPARRAGVLRVPELFGDGGVGRARRGGLGKHHPLQRQRLRAERFGELEREGASGKHLALRVARRGGIRRGEMEFHFMEGAFGVPEPGGGAFGDHLQFVEPGAFTKRAEVFEGFLVKVRQRGGLVGQAGQFHGSGCFP